MFHWNKPPPERKPAEKFKLKATGEFKNFITVSAYAKKYNIDSDYIYNILIPQERVEWRQIDGQKFIDKRYPPFQYSPRKKKKK